MAFSISDLITPIDRDDALETLLSVAASLGLPTTSWQPGNPIRTMLTTVAQKVADVSLIATAIARGGFGDLLSSDAWADAWSQSIYNVFRIQATAATGEVTITNASANSYPLAVGALILAHASTGKTYRNTAAITINPNSTQAGITVAADEVGSAANAATGSVTVVVTTLIGVTVTNPASILGTDAETTPALVARARTKLGSLSPNGPKDAYDYVAKTLAVTAQPITRTNTSAVAGVVTTYLANAAGAPSVPDVAIVQAAFDTYATPWGTTSVAAAAAPVVIPVTYQVWTRSAALTPLAIQTAIANALAVFFAELDIGGYVIPPDSGAVYLDALQQVIGTATPGILRVQVSDPAGTVVLTPNQVAVLGTVTGTITVLS